MNIRKKGEHGYISFMKFFNALVAAVMFVLAAVLFCIGLSVYESKANWLTIVGALFVIPAARFMTVGILFFPYKTTEQAQYDKVFGAMKQGNLLYSDVLFTSTERAYCASFMVITSDKILIFTKHKKMSPDKLQSYLSDIMKRRAFAYKVTCTDDEGKYMNLLRSADSFAEKQYEDEDEKKSAEKERKRLCEVLESFMA
ncbi:MAG: hypothetical protein IKP88_19380 [Lachnospiraceae bacterium]|nr:hypothetical protein [Lachnospiraceae bacterium]